MQMSLAVGEKESPAEVKGIIHFLVKDKEGKFSAIILKDALYNPNLRRNLLSGGKLERLGINFVGRSPRTVESTPKPIAEIGEITHMVLEPSLGQNVTPCKSVDWVRRLFLVAMVPE
ncbi:hypothetical protein AVEN_153176-1 [Araneus ventricosus]|uniref:Uncharacterized protein n=1 Tax=Araneus ventricosus TaxID=182803 RepID=A0A4Y2L6F9_ARAVE|nr:hypothetical protein AVEN_153176-1 [Araneus ventricosus]